jgi:hypothetical protein
VLNWTIGKEISFLSAPCRQSARRKNVAATFVKSKKTYTFATASETDDALFMIVHILAEIAQLVEHNLAKVGVASSSLVFRSGNQQLTEIGLLIFCLCMVEKQG